MTLGSLGDHFGATLGSFWVTLEKKLDRIPCIFKEMRVGNGRIHQSTWLGRETSKIMVLVKTSKNINGIFLFCLGSCAGVIYAFGLVKQSNDSAKT